VTRRGRAQGAPILGLARSFHCCPSCRSGEGPLVCCPVMGALLYHRCALYTQQRALETRGARALSQGICRVVRDLAVCLFSGVSSVFCQPAGFSGQASGGVAPRPHIDIYMPRVCATNAEVSSAAVYRQGANKGGVRTPPPPTRDHTRARHSLPPLSLSHIGATHIPADGLKLSHASHTVLSG
jgi:hypothetical protein